MVVVPVMRVVDATANPVPGVVVPSPTLPRDPSKERMGSAVVEVAKVKELLKGRMVVVADCVTAKMPLSNVRVEVAFR